VAPKAARLGATACAPDHLVDITDRWPELEPVSGIEPLTCRLQGGRSAI
jgi:hypothetical protein